MNKTADSFKVLGNTMVLIIGFLISLTIIGALLGIPLMISSWRSIKKLYDKWE
jgi:hypothetical protein